VVTIDFSTGVASMGSVAESVMGPGEATEVSGAVVGEVAVEADGEPASPDCWALRSAFNRACSAEEFCGFAAGAGGPLCSQAGAWESV
jgi:hypothetical protein